MAERNLGTQFDEAFREGLVGQSKAYNEYGALLGSLASRDLKATQFARQSVDVYMNAAGRLASTGVALAGVAVKAGLRGIGVVASAAGDVADRVEKAVDSAADKDAIVRDNPAGGTVRPVPRGKGTTAAKG